MFFLMGSPASKHFTSYEATTKTYNLAYLLGLWAFLFWIPTAWAQTTPLELTLSEAIELGLEQNLQSQTQVLKAQIAEEQYQMIRAKWFPQLSMDAKLVLWNADSNIYINLGDYLDTKQLLNAIPPAILPLFGENLEQSLQQLAHKNIAMNLRENFTFLYGLHVMQPLTPLLQVHEGTKLALANKKLNEVNNTEENNKLIQEIVDVYLKLTYAQMMVQVLEEVVQTITSHVTQAQKLQTAGFVDTSTVLLAQVELHKAEHNLYEAKNLSHLAALKLAQTLHLAKGQVPIAKDMPAGDLRIKLKELEYYQNKAQENRTELKQLKLAEEIYQTQATIAQYEYIPKVAAIARYEFAHGTQMQPQNQAYIGIGLEWKFFDGFEKYHEAKKAEFEALTYRAQAEQADELIALEVAQKYIYLQNALHNIETQQTAEKLAAESLRTTNLKFNHGEAVHNDVLAAQTQWKAAKAEIVKSKIDTLEALSQLYLATGESPELQPELFMDAQNSE